MRSFLRDCALLAGLGCQSAGASCVDDKNRCGAAPQRRVDSSSFATVEDLYEINTHVGGAGLRGTASTAQAALIDYLEEQFKALGLSTSSDPFRLTSWTPQENNLVSSGSLSIACSDAPSHFSTVQVAGAVPYTKPTNNSGTMIYLPPDSPIKPQNVQGKVILRDVQYPGIPFSTLFANLTTYRTNDTSSLLGSKYDRPYLANKQLTADLTAASHAGAAGLVFLWPMQTKYLEGYFDPHSGTQYSVPAVFAGSEAAPALKNAAKQGAEARIQVRAEIKSATTRQLFATLPGQSAERVYITSHSDGNTWLQDSGVSSVLALARYFSKHVPARHRKRSLVFAITSGHLHGSTDGAARLASQLDAQYDEGDVAAVLALEHLGAVEILPAKSDETRLEVTGNAEFTTFATGPSHALESLLQRTVVARDLSRTAITTGETLRNTSAVPYHSALGGIGTFYHDALVPTAAFLTGPWALWMPVFGKHALDFERLRRQTIAVGDVILGLDMLQKGEIEGGYKAYRQMRKDGFPTSGAPLPPEEVS